MFCYYYLPVHRHRATITMQIHRAVDSITRCAYYRYRREEGSYASLDFITMLEGMLARDPMISDSGLLPQCFSNFSDRGTIARITPFTKSEFFGLFLYLSIENLLERF